MRTKTILSLKDKANQRQKSWRELFEIRVIVSLTREGKFIYHLQGYQRKRWVCGHLNIETKTLLLNEIRNWLNETENEILLKDWELSPPRVVAKA